MGVNFGCPTVKTEDLSLLLRTDWCENDCAAGDLRALQDCRVLRRLCVPCHSSNRLQREPGDVKNFKQ